MKNSNIETQTAASLNSTIDDANFIAEDNASTLKVRAVFIREGVYGFPAGPNGEMKQCLMSRRELKEAARTARAAKVTIEDHPPGKVVMNQSEMKGVVEKPYFDLNRIRGVLNFDKDSCPPSFLEDIKERRRRDVSIGFYYTGDETPGVWNGTPYDLVMRNIVIDHVAAGVAKGRCSYPAAGIGLNAVMSASALNKVGSVVTEQDETPAQVEAPKENVTPPVTPVVEAPKTPAPIKPVPKQVIVKVDVNVPTADLLSRNGQLLKMYQKSKLQSYIDSRKHPT